MSDDRVQPALTATMTENISARKQPAHAGYGFGRAAATRLSFVYGFSRHGCSLIAVEIAADHQSNAAGTTDRSVDTRPLPDRLYLNRLVASGTGSCI